MTTEQAEAQAPFQYEEAKLTEDDLKALATDRRTTGVGKVVAIGSRYIPESRMENWEKQPAPGVRLRELYAEIDPLDCEFYGSQGQRTRFFAMQMDNMDGQPKQANSIPGRFRESARKVGFPDPRELAGKTVAWSRGLERFGGTKGNVFRIEKVYKDGEYVAPNPLPVVDYRESEEYPADAPSSGGAPTPETFRALAAALTGVRGDDYAGISRAIKRNAEFNNEFIKGLHSNEQIVDYMTTNGYVTVDDDGLIQGVN